MENEKTTLKENIKMNELKKATDVSKSAGMPCYVDIVKILEEMTDVQCNDGNWNYDAYMHGMANGMIFALSLFQNKRPEYLEAPDKWLKDIPNADKPICEDEGE